MKLNITVEQFLNDDNVEIYNNGTDITLSLIPYNKEIEDEDAEIFLEFLKQHKDELLEEFSRDSFVIQISGYNIDGLYETNSELIFDESEVYSNY